MTGIDLNKLLVLWSDMNLALFAKLFLRRSVVRSDPIFEMKSMEFCPERLVLSSKTIFMLFLRR
jgi:hypothetical protein